MGTGGGDKYSGDGGLEAACSLFKPDAESPSELSLLGGTSGRHGLTIDNSPNRKLSNRGDAGLLLGIRLLEKYVKGICGAAVASRESFFMSSMDNCNTASHTR